MLHLQHPILWQDWKVLIQKYSKDEELTSQIFEEIVSYYSEKHRAYHNLGHIESLLNLAKQYQNLLEKVDNVRFAIWFHDIIYQPSSSENEENSALLAKKYLKKLGVPENQIQEICAWILASKTHQLLENQQIFDAQFFLDIDLSILGAEKETYDVYCKNIRKEYNIYPDLIYKLGRKKVLQSFIEKPKIYKTDLFFNLLEEKAKANLKREMDNL
ncbi:MAG: hypothetical protein OHK0038_14170 [Flammeovirgaceae bacterium]